MYPSDNFGCPKAKNVRKDVANYYCIFDDMKDAQEECTKDSMCKGYTYLSKEVTKNKDEYRLTRKDPVGHVFHVPSKYYEKEISK